MSKKKQIKELTAQLAKAKRDLQLSKATSEDRWKMIVELCINPNSIKSLGIQARVEVWNSLEKAIWSGTAQLEEKFFTGFNGCNIPVNIKL